MGLIKLAASLLLLASIVQARGPVLTIAELSAQVEVENSLASRSADLAALYPAHTISIPVDHFPDDDRYIPHSKDKFDLRYWFDAQHYKKGGPIIVLHGGETNGEGRLGFLQKGMIAQLAQATNGIAVVMEHRYYGKSMPTKDLSTASLRFLTTEQSLADSAYFSQNVKFKGLEHLDLTAPKTAHILYGGSYAGGQVAFLRKEYPDIFWGAIASSGVTKAIYDYWEYFEPIRKHAPQDCIKATQANIDIVDNIILHKKDKKKTREVKALFGLQDLTHNDDFGNALAIGVYGWQTTNWDPAINDPGFFDYCSNVTSRRIIHPSPPGHVEAAKAVIKAGGYRHKERAVLPSLLNFAGWVNSTFVVPCLARGRTVDQCFTSHDSEFYKRDDIRQTWRGWAYQFCTEWGYLQTGSQAPRHIKTVVSRLINLEYTTIICRESFNIHKPSEVERVNKYGGFDIEFDRLAFIDGDADPWVEATPHATRARHRRDTTNKPFIMIPGATHHWDENGIFPNETTAELPPHKIKKVQAEEIRFVREWMKALVWSASDRNAVLPTLDPTRSPSSRSFELVEFDPNTELPLIYSDSRPQATQSHTSRGRSRQRAPFTENLPRSPGRKGLLNFGRLFGWGSRQRHSYQPVGPSTAQPEPGSRESRKFHRSSSIADQPRERGGDSSYVQRSSGTCYFGQGGRRQRRYKLGIDSVARLATEDEIMKFSHSIQFNAVPDWSSHYIAYSNLKKLIYTLERQVNQPDGGGEIESAPLLDRSLDTDVVFRRALDGELEKICSFYHEKETELYKELAEIAKDVDSYAQDIIGINLDSIADSMNKPRRLSLGTRRSQLGGHGVSGDMNSSTISEPTAADADDSDEDVDISGLPSQGFRRAQSTSSREYNGHARIHTDDYANGGMGDSRTLTGGHDSELTLDPHHSALYNAGVMLKKRVIGIYVSLCELKSFIQLNRTGFAKALKKYDKILDRNMRRNYIGSSVSPAYPFTNSTLQQLDSHIVQVEKLYASFVTKGDLELAIRELRLHLREHVVWERNTVWREMIGIERKAQAANMGIRRTLLGGEHDPAKTQRQGDEQEPTTKEFITPVGRCPVPRWILSSSFVTLVVTVAIFFVLLAIPIMKQPEQQNCLAMLVFVSLLWATEVIPLFVTSILVPFLVVILRIMRSPETGNRLGPKEATGVVFAAMWTPVIMLLLGGFTLAAALSKQDIARRMATFVLSKAGTKPRTVLLTTMFVSMVLSMFISNVAAPVLCFSIIQPLLRNLPTDSRFSKALILGIALAANIGGAASPIASPQNIIALENMEHGMSWGTWFFISLPVCIISILLTWVLLVLTFHPGRGTTIVPIRPVKEKFTGVQWFITIVTIATIGLWCFSHEMEHIFGDMGVIAILPLVLFFGTGILTKEDFNNFLWTIIILASGGLCLGKAVTSSGLLSTIATAITGRVADLGLYSVVFVFAALILVVATFISHTVAALILLPLVREVGTAMENPHPNLLVMSSALMCSVAMGLPTSGFPNMTAIMMEVPETGQRYLRVGHFISRGVPASIMSFLVVVTVGYGLMIVAGL
ncbi:low-affinity phosphate transporter [Myotisia sp. PD_48]|nr:low-affinity phosphate transporter [Myotisia sp. PD_48]